MSSRREPISEKRMHSLPKKLHAPDPAESAVRVRANTCEFSHADVVHEFPGLARIYLPFEFLVPGDLDQSPLFPGVFVQDEPVHLPTRYETEGIASPGSFFSFFATSKLTARCEFEQLEQTNEANGFDTKLQNTRRG